MANEIQVNYTSGESNMYATIHQEDGQVMVVGDGSFTSFVNNDTDDYEITLTEEGNSGMYVADVPAILTDDGKFTIKAWQGITPGAATNIGGDTLYWDGSAEIEQTEYDLEQIGMSDTTVEAVATNLKEGLAQLWRRFFKRVTKDGSAIVTYKDDNTTGATTQGYTEDTTDVVEEATTVP